MASNRMSTSDLLKQFLNGQEGTKVTDQELVEFMSKLPDVKTKPFNVDQDLLATHLMNAGAFYQSDTSELSLVAKLKSYFQTKEISRVSSFQQQVIARTSGTFGLKPNEILKSIIQDITLPSGQGALETSTEYRSLVARSVISYLAQDYQKQKLDLSKVEKNIMGAFLEYFHIDNLTNFNGINRALGILNHLLFLDDQTLLATLIFQIFNPEVLGTSKKLKNRLKDAACACFDITPEMRRRIECKAVAAYSKNITTQGQASLINQIEDDAIPSALKVEFKAKYPEFAVFELAPLDVKQSPSVEANDAGEELKEVKVSTLSR